MTQRTSGGHTSSMGWDVEIATEDDRLLRNALGEGPMEKVEVKVNLT